MACYHPITAYYPLKTADNTGKLVFKISQARGFPNMVDATQIPCGQCIGCKLDHSRRWAIRLMHEAQTHDENSFITLTYNDENIPPTGTLIKRDFQLFMKRLRKDTNVPIRFYHCGEYGENTSRPHYHALIFGYSFPDRTLHSTNHRDEKLYISEKLTQLWGMGHSLIGEITFDSAAYVARYCTKKITGKKAFDHYTTNVCTKTGLITQKLPEYSTMSLKPGIGAEWFKKYQTDVYPSDSVIVNGHELKPPKYYDNLYEIIDKDKMAQIKRDRYFASQEIDEKENSRERLAVKEKIKSIKIKRLYRGLA